MSIRPGLTLTDPPLYLPFFVVYQPIVDLCSDRVVAYEALTRGADGTPYPQLITHLDPVQLRAFQRRIAIRAMQFAVDDGFLHMDAALTININPDIEHGALDAHFLAQAARHYGIHPSRIIVELTENHKISLPQLRELVARNQRAGFQTAMDDFGAGYCGLTMLADCRPEILKLDRNLITGIETCVARQTIVQAFVNVCRKLKIQVIAEGVEQESEMRILRGFGISRMQGYLFSRPVRGLVSWSGKASPRKASYAARLGEALRPSPPEVTAAA